MEIPCKTVCSLCNDADAIIEKEDLADNQTILCSSCGRYMITWQAYHHAILKGYPDISKTVRDLYDKHAEIPLIKINQNLLYIAEIHTI